MCEGEEGELAELERLRGVELGEGRCGFVVGVGAIAEDLEEREVRDVFLGAGEGLDLRCCEELGKDKGVGVGGCAGDEVCCCARGRGGFGEGEEGLGKISWVVEDRMRRSRLTARALRALVCSMMSRYCGECGVDGGVKMVPRRLIRSSRCGNYFGGDGCSRS